MMNHIIRRVARLGIADRFHFTGFLRGEDVHKMFQLSDVYVMPSVSEPFGISPLEAMRSNVPVIISKQSGVAEVLDYAVKVDYWDVDALADAIYGLVKYPALSNMFASKGLEEVTNLKWNDAAAKIKAVYEEVIEENKNNKTYESYENRLPLFQVHQPWRLKKYRFSTWARTTTIWTIC